MEMLTTFLSTNTMVLFLIPVILILVVLLVVINMHGKVETIEQVPVPQVTTTPMPSNPAEVVSQAIPQTPAPVAPPVTVQAPDVPATPQPVAVAEPQVIPAPVMEVEQPVVEEVALVEAPAQVVSEPVAVSTTAWRPAVVAPLVDEEKPFIEEAHETTLSSAPLEQELDAQIATAVPVVEPVIQAQTVNSEPTDMAPMVTSA